MPCLSLSLCLELEGVDCTKCRRIYEMEYGMCNTDYIHTYYIRTWIIPLELAGFAISRPKMQVTEGSAIKSSNWKLGILK